VKLASFSWLPIKGLARDIVTMTGNDMTRKSVNVKCRECYTVLMLFSDLVWGKGLLLHVVRLMRRCLGGDYDEC